jgi:PKD repeat protein
MNSIHCNTKTQAVGPRAPASGLVAGLVLSAVLGASSWAADMYRPPSNLPGGVPAQATVTSITPQGTNTTVCWYGMQGWYTVERSTNNAPPWTAVGSTAASDFASCLTVPTGTNGSAFFRLNQNNAYVGSGACAGCHGDKHSEWSGTIHSGALSTLDAIGMGQNPACLACHTVGFGQPTGYTSRTNTPNLTDVGCENCHGPAGWHKYSDHDLIHPAVSIDPAICGGCHQGSHHPTYEEYSTSLHAQVNDDVNYGFNSGVYYPGTVVIGGKTLYGYYVTTNSDLTLKTNATTGIFSSSHVPGSPIDPGQDRQVGCGMCHSGQTRHAMLDDYEARQAGTTNALNLPSAHDSGAWGPTCGICHDPHDKYNVAQLRNPTRSTNYFTLPTTADKRVSYTTNFQGSVTTNVAYYGTTFSTFYDPNIQVCGQCHNTRGARWDGLAYGLITNGTTVTVGLTTNVTGYSRPPHHSPQYNILIGIVQPDYLTTNDLGVATNYLARHSGFSGSPFNTNQCATCHVPNYSVNANTNVTGHTFDLDTKGCALGGCHSSGVPDIGGTQVNTTNNLARLVDLLNQWATNKAPAILGATAYNQSLANSWEFNTIGGLATMPNPGPVATNQVKLPAEIRQARFNAYMVYHDGSAGVHNPGYLRFLLNDAETKVLSQFDVARFRANTPSAFVNGAVFFTNLNPAATSCNWDFGDGVTISSLGPVSHAYASPGTYSVTLTTTDPTGTQTLTRNNYIIVYAQPVPSFTATPSSGTGPLTVTFVNNSVNATYYRWNFMYGVTGTPYSNDPNPAPFTYTNAGTYQVRLTAYNPGGSVSVTNTITVTP